jgi:hypothetical protein
MIGRTIHLAPKPFGIACDILLEITGGQNFGEGQPTAYRAKSSIFVPELKRLYVADSAKGKPDAKLELQIFEVQ